MRKAIILAVLSAILLGPAMARDLEEILASGRLVVGLRKTPTTYVVDPKTGAESGLTWELAAFFAASKADGRFSGIVRKYTGFSYGEYLAIMGGKP